MGLVDRLKQVSDAAATPAPAANARTNNRQLAAPVWETLKGRLHEQLITKLDLASMERLPRDQRLHELQTIITELMDATGDLPLNRAERALLTTELIDEV